MAGMENRSSNRPTRSVQIESVAFAGGGRVSDGLSMSRAIQKSEPSYAPDAGRASGDFRAAGLDFWLFSRMKRVKMPLK